MVLKINLMSMRVRSACVRILLLSLCAESALPVHIHV